uniref:Inhibitor_I29 domain-containing protein n=1 Tax=Steinernema glaseri TaxID=37863 RepID=A0A1I7YGM8_9BILA
MEVDSNTKEREDEIFKRINRILWKTLVLTFVVIFCGSWMYFSYMANEDTTKPCDTNAFLDKAFSLHERRLSYFNLELRRWIREDKTRSVYQSQKRSPEEFSKRLNELIK